VKRLQVWRLAGKSTNAMEQLVDQKVPKFALPKMVPMPAAVTLAPAKSSGERIPGIRVPQICYAKCSSFTGRNREVMIWIHSASY
jgi:hypothetical protein